MGETAIQWTDTTWNPARGCSRVSRGCRNCYAERMAARFSKPGETFHGFARMTPHGARWTGKVELVQSKLAEPLRWRKPRRVFVNSMSDLFHEALTNVQINQVFAAMARAERHTFQVLTKRPQRMLEYFAWARVANATVKAWVLPNVWLGVSVEDQKTADERIPFLLRAPAAVRFVSYEPALGPVDFRSYVLPPQRGLGPAPRLDWCIVGGESGPGARPFDVEWARAAVRQCREAGVAVFVKQLGARIVADSFDSFPPYMLPARWFRGGSVFIPPIIGGRERLRAKPEGALAFGLCDAKGGDMDEWPEDLRVREFPQ